MLKWTQSPVLIHIRLVASLALMFFALTHFLNHALGLISLDTMEAGRKIFLAFWRNSFIQFVFPVVLFLHAQSAIWRLMFRQAWRFSAREKFKILTGLAVPLLLLLHVSGTRLMWWVYDYNDTYAYYLYHNFRGPGVYILVTMSILIWTHAYIGVTDLLNLKSWFYRYRTAFAITYAAVPILGLAGIISASGQINRLAENPQWLRGVIRTHGGDPQYVTQMQFIFYLCGVALVALLIGSLFLARLILLKHARRHATLRVIYAGGPEVFASANATLLEVSLANNVEHAHVCGGNGRCSTCRVRVLAGQQNLSQPAMAENSVLKKIGAETDVRLACQAKISGDVKIAPLVGASQATYSGAAHLLTRQPTANGREKEVVVFFSDLRGFTSFSEHKLPYDVVFVLNQYFRSMGKIIEQHEGFIDKFIGDGIMAIFGLKEEIGPAARHAIEASLKMQEQLARINEVLADELAKPLEIGIGLHAGPAILGELGYGAAAHLTAIGDVVNTASRLEHANKQLGTWFVFSAIVAEHAGMQNMPTALERRVQLRGKSEPLGVYAVAKGETFTPDFKT